MKRCFFLPLIFCLALLSPATAGAQEGSVPKTTHTAGTASTAGSQTPALANQSLESLLGKSPAELNQLLGFPGLIYPLRGDTAEQDDVVFGYPDLGLAFVIWNDQIWQIHLAASFDGNFRSIAWPPEQTNLSEQLGPALRSEENWTDWPVPGMLWPVRLRTIADEEGHFKEAYLYRGDF